MLLLFCLWYPCIPHLGTPSNFDHINSLKGFPVDLINIQGIPFCAGKMELNLHQKNVIWRQLFHPMFAPAQWCMTETKQSLHDRLDPGIIAQIKKEQKIERICLELLVLLCGWNSHWALYYHKFKKIRKRPKLEREKYKIEFELKALVKGTLHRLQAVPSGACCLCDGWG